MFKKFSAAKAALAAMVFSMFATGAAFADTGGGSSIVDPAELESTITGATSTIGTVGMAILGVLAAIMVYRLVKGIMGR